MKIGILGFGAVGHALFYCLNKTNKATCVIYSRVIESARSISFREDRLVPNIKTEIYGKKDTSLDYLLICVKEYHVVDVRRQLKDRLSSETKVIVIRNGLDLHLDYSDVLGKHTILPSIINCPIQKIKENGYHLFDLPKLLLPKNALSGKVLSDLRWSGLEVDLVDDFYCLSWIKLIESSAIGSIQFLYGQASSIFKQKDTRKLLKSLLSEFHSIANAANIGVDLKDLELMYHRIISNPADKGSSMLSDMLQNKAIEIEAKNGVLFKKAKEMEVHTPINDKIFRRLRNWNKGVRVNHLNKNLLDELYDMV